MNELFENTIIRTLGLYQPFASLMLHGKVETRMIRLNKKPPFPLGKYLIYSTKRKYTAEEMLNISGAKQVERIDKLLKSEPTKYFVQQAICIGDLVSIRPMTINDEDGGFVEYAGIVKQFKNGETIHAKQWCLFFENIKRIHPFEFKLGKQGVGILPDNEKKKIKITI